VHNLTSILLFSSLLVESLASAKTTDSAEQGKLLAEKVVAAVGGMKKLYALRDVQYTYTYRTPQGKEDVSIERYRFDGELSWARYTKREAHVFPRRQGEVIQGYDGKQSWMTIGDKVIVNPKLVKMADFLRKTNFYWFAMMHKLTDPGTHHRHKGISKVNGVDYHLVELTFGEGVGDVQDKYVLYVHPKTHLVDQFLFTVMDFGMRKPYLMRVKYAKVNGVTLPVTRRYTSSNWKGRIKKNAQWTEELMTDIKFDNGFETGVFERPEG